MIALPCRCSRVVSQSTEAYRITCLVPRHAHFIARAIPTSRSLRYCDCGIQSSGIASARAPGASLLRRERDASLLNLAKADAPPPCSAALSCHLVSQPPAAHWRRALGSPSSSRRATRFIPCQLSTAPFPRSPREVIRSIRRFAGSAIAYRSTRPRCRRLSVPATHRPI